VSPRVPEKVAGIAAWPREGVDVDDLGIWVDQLSDVRLDIRLARAERVVWFVKATNWQWSPGKDIALWGAAFSLVRPACRIWLAEDESLVVTNSTKTQALGLLLHSAKVLWRADSAAQRRLISTQLFNRIDRSGLRALDLCAHTETAQNWEADTEGRALFMRLERQLIGMVGTAVTPSSAGEMWARLCRAYESWLDRHPLEWPEALQEALEPTISQLMQQRFCHASSKQHS
jgi:hypothetical protein